MARGQPLSDPKRVRCFSDKLAVYEIGCRALFLVALRGDDVTAAFARAAPTVASHDMRNAILAGMDSLVGEFRPNLRHAVALGQPLDFCQFPAYRSQFVFGVMAPVDCRHKGATSFSA